MKNVLVIGAYGFIGSAIVKRLLEDGCQVTGLGRDRQTAEMVHPHLSWIIRDIADLTDMHSWIAFLHDKDVVINCAGALQDGKADCLEAVHGTAIAALAGACRESGAAFVQISAVGAHDEASTAFMRSKSAGDTAVRESQCKYWIFRPGLVIGQSAYGGTALMRMIASIPRVQPIAFPGSPIQTVALQDVAEAVSMAVRGELPSGLECDLVEDETHELGEVVSALRRWLGFAPARFEFVVPYWILSAVADVADLLGRLGWRSPLRSTATEVLKEGVTGDSRRWRKASGSSLSSLNETLARISSSAEARFHARSLLLMPLVIATLSFFWIASGLIGLFRFDRAVAYLAEAGWSLPLAQTSVIFWSFVDLALGLMVLVRRFAKTACLLMVGVAVFYLVAATIFLPHLWIDPMGPLVKVVPGAVLALFASVLLTTR